MRRFHPYAPERKTPVHTGAHQNGLCLTATHQNSPMNPPRPTPSYAAAQMVWLNLFRSFGGSFAAARRAFTIQ